MGAKVNCKTPSYSSVLLGQNVVKKIPSKKEWKIDNEQEEEIRRHSFFFIVQIFLPYCVLWTSCFSEQDYTKVCLIAFIYLLILDERELRRCTCYRITGLQVLLCVYMVRGQYANLLPYMWFFFEQKHKTMRAVTYIYNTQDN